MPMNLAALQELIEKAETDLLPSLVLKSIAPEDPVEINNQPEGWVLLGKGNFAAVFTHPDFDSFAIKVYAKGRPGLRDEIAVYRKLGSHPAYSECYHAGISYLILKRLQGVTLYDCLKRGIRIPRQVIIDVDQALSHAIQQGLNPRDVHGKNVMVAEGRGCIVDVSAFLYPGHDPMWDDLKKAYHRFYWPFLILPPPPVPGFILNWARKSYRRIKSSDLTKQK
ncbi:serine/threonine-protein kinase [Paenibacillus senegalensis]|uniref:serine/threonine protein kinase n=1 Tax=Paenibacillus senegalensis TaxID=1465766 RepID=UPI0002883F70|nr:serine/threonine protein kinase [Paenibacillus senegalensis]